MRQHWRELVASVLLMTGLAAAVHLIAYYLPNYATFQLNIPRATRSGPVLSRRA